jgi:hypothetical protein
VRFGHFPIGRDCELERVYDMYESWLAGQQQSHSPAHFRHWVREAYRPGHLWAQIGPLDVPERVPPHYRVPIRFRVRNISPFPWQFKQAANAGVHIYYQLRSAQQTMVGEEGAGFFNETVPPGESIDLSLALPTLAPGRYSLLVDLRDEKRGWFSLAGSQPFRKELEVHD